MNKKHFFIGILTLFYVYATAQESTQRVGINTESPGETVYIENEKLQTLLDVNGTLRVRDVPELEDRTTYVDERTNDISKSYAERLYWDYTQGTIEVPGYPDVIIEPPFYVIRYRLTPYRVVDNGDTAWKNLIIRDFDTKIDASNFTAMVVECSVEQQEDGQKSRYQGVYHIGLYKQDMRFTEIKNALGFNRYDNPANVKKIQGQDTFNPTENMITFVKNGTWHINIEPFQARASFDNLGYVQVLTYDYDIKVLAINNNYINRIRIPGKAIFSQIKGVQTGAGNTVPEIDNPGRDVLRYKNMHNQEVPWGTVGENPLKDEWIIPNNTERDSSKPYEF